MKRSGRHEPTIERLIELSGIETLHPGGLALSRRTAEVARFAPGMKVLDVSSGRGTQALLYAGEFGVDVTGIDLSEEMVRTASARALAAGLSDRVRFEVADSQRLPFPAATFDAVINECAVGIPDDSQAVLDEMVRVVRPGGAVVIHESTWRSALEASEADELAERYGTTPLPASRWQELLRRAGAEQIETESEPWSRPESFWKVRADRDVKAPGGVLTLGERLRTVARVLRSYGARGVWKALENERVFYRAVLAGKLGYALYWAQRPAGVGVRSAP
jgi:SAM-dependent methyltransferase